MCTLRRRKKKSLGTLLKKSLFRYGLGKEKRNASVSIHNMRTVGCCTNKIPSAEPPPSPFSGCCVSWMSPLLIVGDSHNLDDNV